MKLGQANRHARPRPRRKLGHEPGKDHPARPCRSRRRSSCSAPVRDLSLDRGGQILRANLTVSEQLGTPRESLTRKRLSAFVNPAQASSLALFLRRVFEAPVKRRLDLRLRGAEGRFFHAQIEALAAVDEYGALTV